MSPMLMTTAIRYVSHEDAMDVLQDSYLNLFKILKRTKLEEGREVPYIHRIVINNCLKKIRKKKIDFRISDNQPFQETAGPIILDELSVDYILKMINKLPAACRLCFQLYEVDGYSHKEIGEKINISASISRAHLSRAKKLLQIEIEAYNEAEKIKLVRI